MNIEPSFDTWTSIFLVVALHGIILSALFFFRKEGRSLPNKLLGLLLLIFSLNLFGNILFWTKYSLAFPHLTGISGTFFFLYGPVLFFYVLSIVKPNRDWKLWDAIHLLPFIALVIWKLPFFLRPASEKTAMLVQYADQELSAGALVIASLKATAIVSYTVAIIYFILHRKKWGQKELQNISSETYRWVRVISCNFLGFVIAFITYYVLVKSIDFQVKYDYLISFAMSCFIFGIGYLGLIKPTYLEEAHNGKYKYESSSLSTEEADLYLKKLLAYVTEEKPYLNGDLKIVDLADQLSISSHHLSQIINSRLKKNFFEFVNTYRIDEAKKILSDPEKKRFKILRVAFESGFNNKTTFNSTFKDKVGTTPSQFRKEQLSRNRNYSMD